MNRRNFLGNLAKSFFILPSAGRVWKAVAKTPVSVDIESHIYDQLPSWFSKLHAPARNYDHWQRVLKTTRWLPNMADTCRQIDPHQLGHLKAKLATRYSIKVLNNPPIIRPR